LGDLFRFSLVNDFYRAPSIIYPDKPGFCKNTNIKLIHWILGGFLEKLKIIFKIIHPILQKLYGENFKDHAGPGKYKRR
jgi:hypothetical protein